MKAINNSNISTPDYSLLNYKMGESSKPKTGNPKNNSTLLKYQSIFLSPSMKVKRSIPFKNKFIVDPVTLIHHINRRFVKRGAELKMRMNPSPYLDVLNLVFDGKMSVCYGENQERLGANDICLASAGKTTPLNQDIGSEYREKSGWFEGLTIGIMRNDVDKTEDANLKVLNDLKWNPIGNNNVKARIISGSVWGFEGPLEMSRKTTIADVIISPGHHIRIPKRAGHNSVIHIVGGFLNSDDRTCFNGNSLVVNPDSEEIIMECPSTSLSKGRFVLISAEPQRRTVLKYGNSFFFHEEDLEQAMKQLYASRNIHQ